MAGIDYCLLPTTRLATLCRHLTNSGGAAIPAQSPPTLWTAVYIRDRDVAVIVLNNPPANCLVMLNVKGPSPRYSAPRTRPSAPLY